MFRKGMVLILILTMLFSFSVFADETLTVDKTETGFSDVNEDDWFYDAVMTMSQYDIISGYPDGTFKPQNPVKREEFATMMVKALKLEVVESKSSFVDVSDDYWASDWIETAKPYMTGWTKNGDYVFKPTEYAVREDMAVALVNALSKPADDTMLPLLDDYEDGFASVVKGDGGISANLRPYMASAVKHGLISGSVENEMKYLKPQGTLTRAEAAALLMSVINEEKIVFNDDEEKVVFEDTDVTLQIKEVEGGLKLYWDYTGASEPKGYKVVASLSDETPAYPENGNAKYVQGNSATVYSKDGYNGGDFANFKSGESYYFSITALVGDTYVTSNVVKKTMPAAISVEGKIPQVKVSQAGDGVVVEWQAIDTVGLQGYKVVASMSDETPVYPENGYATWITNLNTLTYYIEPGTSYHGGDLSGKFKPGETYYFSVTAVYNSGKIAGNTVKFIMPGEPQEEEEVTIAEKTPKVEAVVNDGKLVIEWGQVSTLNLQGYKIVASKSNPAPIYPGDGYAYWITDLTSHRQVIAPGQSYSGGDMDGQFKSGETYYVSVTAVYNDMKVPGNSVKITMP
ncbi:S-layer homology domain-containing protein [Acidaminobacter sp. JC074]|uniref:S-layer homology domain-containing protein n=1 Tax=Acidaminobacter sp. JC074 TaxID=2530199 RepID=UPI001F11156C|nr:S-layer homology domain-containing protein [Acidaminobacter sp. JC074]MCH4890446.1 S-layer homology domain-containing protein [Acidaminobacter sp. JC074]